MAKIEFLFDIVCPWCYIGKKYFDQIDSDIFKRLEGIEWKSYLLNPNMPKEGIDRDVYMIKKFNGIDNAKNVYNNVRLAGIKAGINFNFDLIRSMPNSTDAMALISKLKNNKNISKIINSLFEAFFEKGKNINDKNVLKEYFEDFLDISTIENISKSKIKEKIIQEDLDFKKKGIDGVPAIIIDQKKFISGAQETKKLEGYLKNYLA